MRWLLLSTVVAVAGTFGAGMLSVDGTSPVRPPTTHPAAAAGESLVFAAGFVEGAQREVNLQFELSGRIVSIPVTEGQWVVQGDVCAQLDDAFWRHKLHEAEAALELARAERERLLNGTRAETREVVRAEARLAAVEVRKAEAEMNRAARLYEQNAKSAQDYDNRRFEHELALARYEQARARVIEIEAEPRPDELRMAESKVQAAAAAVDQARTMLARTMLVAPRSGIILRVDAEPGELVAVEQPRTVVTMTSIDEMRVRAYVEELDALSLRVGARAYATADGRPDVRYAGRVQWMAPVMGAKRHRHRQPGEQLDVRVREVLVVLEDARDLVIGLPVDVFIESGGNGAAPAEPANYDNRPAAWHGESGWSIPPGDLTTPVSRGTPTLDRATGERGEAMRPQGMAVRSRPNG